MTYLAILGLFVLTISLRNALDSWSHLRELARAAREELP